MYKPSIIESPSGWVPEKAPRWDLMGTEGYDGEKVFWWTFLVVLGYFRIYRAEIEVGGLPRGPQDRGAPYPPGRALHPCVRLVAPPTSSPSLMVCFRSKKDHPESSFGLRLVFLLCKTLKQAKNKKLALGSRLIG